ncbi:MAG: CRISPR-associated helicase/endonuclease Cas3, partial [Ktedonobacterales bacterium]
EQYGATVVLCTATQPALEERTGFPGLPGIREIVPNAAQLFTTLKRVEYDWPAPGETVTWNEIAAEMRQTPQALAIVNTRADAADLLVALDEPGALHLSTRMCGAHRRAVLADARSRLARNEPCRLVATQLIEAGVDIDFPLVLRALGPLDRIVQSAGRCNREGKLTGTLGRVRIFVPEGRHMPSGVYRTGTELTAGLLNAQPDLHDPSVYSEYFRELYRQIDPDEKRVQDVRRSLDYPAVAERFKLIEDDTNPVVVLYGDDAVQQTSRDHLARLRTHQGRARDLLRALQPYIVGLRPKELSHAQAAGKVEEVMPGLWEWKGMYDTEQGRGIVLDAPVDPARLIW